MKATKLAFLTSLISTTSAFEFLDSFNQIGSYGQSLLNHFTTVADDTPFSLTSPGIYADILEYANYSGAAYCIDTTEGVKIGYLNSSCLGKDCVSAEDDVYVIREVNDISNALILKDESEKQIIVAFQGSVLPVDWLIDTSYFNLDYVPYGEANGIGMGVGVGGEELKVHAGFKTAADNFLSIAGDVLAELHRMYPDFTYRVTGHSLGGALASITGLELYLMGYDVSIISFAAPKVFNPALANWVDEAFHTEQYIHDLKEGNLDKIPLGTFTRITHHGDIVPCVPVAELIPEYVSELIPLYIPYRHAGVEFFIEKDGLPQPIETVKIRGKFSPHYEKRTWLHLFSLSTHLSTNVTKMLEERLITKAHLFYFEVVSECQHRDDPEYSKYD